MATAITVIGDALLDVHVVPAEPPRPGGDVPAEIRLEPGGQGANVSVRLARRGLPVRLVCALGPDAAGSLLRERLAADGVEVVDLVASATGAVVVLLDAARERTMFSQRVPLAMGLRPELLAEVGLARRLRLPPSRARRGHLRLRRLAASRPAGMLARLDRGRRLAGGRPRPAAAPRGPQRGGSARDLRRRRVRRARSRAKSPTGWQRSRSSPTRAARPRLSTGCRPRSRPQPAEDRRSTRPAPETRSARA